MRLLWATVRQTGRPLLRYVTGKQEVALAVVAARAVETLQRWAGLGDTWSETWNWVGHA